MKYLYALLLSLCVLTGTARAAIPFDTDFETCAVGTDDDFPCEGWIDSIANVTTGEGESYASIPIAQRKGDPAFHNKIEIVNNMALTGSKSVKTTFVSNAYPDPNESCALQNPSLYTYFTGQDHIFARFGLRKSVGFLRNGNNITKMFRMRTSGANPTVSVWMKSDGTVDSGEYFISVESGWAMGSTNYFGGPKISNTAFDQVEVEYLLNTPGQANGLVRLWVNDKLSIERLNLALRGPLPTSSAPSTTKFAEAQIFVQCGLGSMWWDRVGMRTDQRLGLVSGTTPPPVDTIPPTPPPTPPPALTGNSATSTLTWVAGSDSGGSGYGGVQIFRCVRTAGDCTATTQLTVVAAPALSYVDSGCSPGFTCDYRQRYYDGAGNVSTYTSEVSLTIPTTNRRVLVTDTFGRADAADIGATYDSGYVTGVTTSAFKIASGKLAPSTNLARNLETYNVAVPNDQFASIRASDGVSADDNIFVLLRAGAPPDWTGYECGVLSTTSGRLQRYATSGGVSTGTLLASLATISPAFAIGDRIRGEAQGAVIRCYIVRTNAQGVQSEELFASATDATYASGRVGFRNFPNAGLPGVRVNEFLAGDFTNAVDSTILHDSTATSALANVATSLSWNHTVGTASNRLLTTCLQTRNSGSAVTVPTVTANGISLVNFRTDTRTNGTLNLHTSLWRQIAPTPGVNTIVATFSAAPTSYAIGSSSSFSGVEQVAPVDAVGGATGTGTAVSLPLTTTVTGTLAIDCVAGLEAFSSAGGSQTVRRSSVTTVNTDGIGVSTKGLAAAGAATTAWTQSAAVDWAGSVIAIKPAQVNNLERPKVLTGTFVPTGVTGITNGTTTPTAYRVKHGQNSGFNVQEVTIPIASAPGGVITRTWNTGDEFATVYAIDAFGVVNGTNQEYIANTLVGIAPAANETAVTMTNPQPSTELPAGTTSALITMTIDQPQLTRRCRAHTADVAYASMPTTYEMTLSSTFASVAYPVSNGNSYTIYRTCVVLNSSDEVVAESATRSSSTFTVANSTADVTPPATVTNLVCTPSGTQVDCTHTAATDAVSYEASLSVDAGVTYVLVSAYTGISFSLTNLVPTSTYSMKVWARDVVGNPSAAYSNVSTFLMPVLTDVIPPADVPKLQIIPYTSSAEAVFTVGADAANTTIEWCESEGCLPGQYSKTGLSSPIILEDLTPGTVYQATAYHSDSAGNPSAIKYPTITFTTPTTGRGRPSGTLQYGATRATGTRAAAASRAVRP